MTKNKKSKASVANKLAAMVSAMTMLKRAKKKKTKKTNGRITGASMGPVATINTAPVAIGNSVRGSRCVSKNIKNGVLVCGRDFMFTPVGTGSVSTWTLCGGTPLTPAAFADATIRQYMQMYQKFRWKRCVVHYITSSPTSANGDVMFYRQKNRNSVFLNQTSSYLLPFVISDPDTVIGPQWTNHSSVMTVTGDWKSTDYGMSSQLDDYADGEMFLLSKTSTTDSPGYVLFDYEIEFAEMQISPRLLALPLPRAQWYNLSIGGAGITNTVNGAFNGAIYGNNISGAQSSAPAGAAAGDIYKVVFDTTNSSTVPAGVLTLKNEIGGGNTDNIALQDGTTLYAAYGTSNSTFYFYINAEAAFVGENNTSLVYSATNAAATWTLQMWISLVGTGASTNVNPNY